MQILIGYLDKVLQEAGLSADIANRARFQQNQILGEMEKIKSELDRLTGQPAIQSNMVNNIYGQH